MTRTINSKGYAIYQSTVSRSDEWLTPLSIIEALGRFDLDPCAPVNRPWDTATHHYTIEDNGFLQDWAGRVWLNPPYGKQMYAWVNKLALHGNGIALIFNRSCVPRFHRNILDYVDATMLIEGRIQFYNTEGKIPTIASGKKTTSTAPSILCAFGDNNVYALHEAKRKGLIKGTIMYPYKKLPIIVVGISATWKNVVSHALFFAGGKSDLTRIYELVEILAPDKVEKNKFFREKIRQTLQIHFEKIRRGEYACSVSN